MTATLRRDFALPAPSELIRNGVFLAASQGAAATIGFLFWILVARRYSDAVVGADATVIATFTTVSLVAQLNYAHLLPRLIPSARNPRRLVAEVYRRTGIMSVVLAGGVVVGLAMMSPSLAFLGRSPVLALWFVLGTISWSWFTIQDGCMAGLGLARSVAVENVAFATLKIALVILLGHLGHGIFISWVVATVVAVAFTSVYLDRKLPWTHAIGAHKAETDDGPALFRSLDFGGALCHLTMLFVLPLIVLSRLGAAPAAYFAIAMSIAVSLDGMALGGAISFTVESARAEARMAEHLRSSLRTFLLPVVAVSVVGALGAVYILWPFGSTYQVEAAWPMRWLLLAIPARFVLALSAGVFRIAFAGGAILLPNLTALVLCVPGSVLLAESHGVAGVAFSWFVAQWCAVTVALVLLRRQLAGKAEVEVEAADHASASSPALRRLARSRRHRDPTMLVALGSCLVALALINVVGGTLGGLALLGHLTVGVGVSGERRVFRSPAGPSARLARSAVVGATCTVIAAQPLIWSWTYRPATLAVSAAIASVLFALVAGPGGAPNDVVPRPQRTTPTARVWPSARTANSLGIAAVACVVAVRSTRSIGPQSVDGLGLLRALPSDYWVAIAMGALATLLLLDGQDRRFWPVAPALWVFLAHGVGHSTQPLPRFPTVWVHRGLGDYLIRYGADGALIDARMAWPGAFAVVAAPFDLLDAGVVDTVVRWWPVVIVGLAACFVWDLARAAMPAMAASAPIACIAFVFASWTGQDYFSPQSLGVLLYLAMMVALNQASAGSTHDKDHNVRGPAVGALLFGAAAILSHPLTPIFIALSLGVLMAYRRRMADEIFAVLTAGFAVWFVVSAEPWWSSQIADMVRQLGQPWQNFLSRPVSASAETTVDRAIVLTARRGYMAVLVAVVAASIGAVWRSRPRPIGGVDGAGSGNRLVAIRTTLYEHRLGRADMTPEASDSVPMPTMLVVGLTIVPFAAVFLQSYGGEIALRSFFFAAPWMSILAARLVVNARPKHAIVAAAVPVLFVVPFLVARFGNDGFEVSRQSDRAAVQTAYELARESPDRFVFISTDFDNPWGDELVGDVPYMRVPLEANAATWLAAARESITDPDRDRVLVVLTDSERHFRMETTGASADRLDRFAADLRLLGAAVRWDQQGSYVLEMEL